MQPPRPRILALIGSGETASQMTRVQRSVVRRLLAPGERPAQLSGVILDTPYGFQANADALSANLLDHLGRRLGLDAQLASYRRSDADELASEEAAARVRAAAFVFSGPGSPSYALRQWRDSAIPQLFRAKLVDGGALVMASAAALTMGRFSVPVYEIYKSGADPHWLAGLDVLSTLGVAAAVIPHWDNAEGAGHDTRYCFLGEERLEELEAQLPENVLILGIDEHTALVIDVDADRATVEGRGRVTLRRAGASVAHAAGAAIGLAELRIATEAPGQRAQTGVVRESQSGEATLAQQLLEARGEARELAGRAALVQPLVEALLELRAEARAAGDYSTGDAIRRRLSELGVEVSDAPDGKTDYRLPPA